MKQITSKFITDNLDAMKDGKHVSRCGIEYWMTDTEDGQYEIYKVKVNEKSAENTGSLYGKLVDGVPYQL